MGMLGGMKTDLDYIWSVPRKLPKGGKVIVHNRVHAQWENQELGLNGFRAWIEAKENLPEHADLCDCGWSGLVHYRIDAKEGEPMHYGKPPSVRGKRMPSEYHEKRVFDNAFDKARKAGQNTMTVRAVKYRIIEKKPGSFRFEEIS
jgi:hypothetical protein